MFSKEASNRIDDNRMLFDNQILTERPLSDFYMIHISHRALQ